MAYTERMAERLIPNRQAVEETLDRFVTQSSEQEAITSRIAGMFKRKIDFLHGKLAPHVFINTRKEPVDWNPVIGLGYKSTMWAKHSHDRCALDAFLESAGLEIFGTDPISSGDDALRPGMRQETYLLGNIPPLCVTGDGEHSIYHIAYRELIVKNEEKIGDARKEYEFGPSGTVYQEIGILKTS